MGGLKADRDIYVDKIDCFLNEAAEPGVLCVYSTYGSGASMDNTRQLVTVAADPSGAKVAGVLVNEVVDIDTTRYFVNTQKNQVNKGSKVQLIQRGFIVTNQVEQGTISGGEAAYIGQSGLFANAGAITTVNGVLYGCAVTENTNMTTFPKVGRFVSTADEFGYVKIEVDIK